MTLAAIIQLVAACIGIVGSLFFAIGIIRQNTAAMARLSYTYWDANPHMPAVLAAQKADYVFGGGLIVLAFALQLVSFFSIDPAPFLSAAAAARAPWIAIPATVLLFFAVRGASVTLARRYQAAVEEFMRKEEEEQERKQKEERESRNNAS
jgi:hypothetical protein